MNTSAGSFENTAAQDTPQDEVLESADQIDDTDDRVLQRTAKHLADRYDGVFSQDLVERYVYESYMTLHRNARVKKFVASLAGNFAESRLRALAYATGKLERPKPQVLFVCAENAGRSQLAAAALTELAGDDVEVRSAGSRPSEDLYPEVVKLLQERGVDPETIYPKPLTDDIVRGADYVVSMSSYEDLPPYPGQTFFEWDMQIPRDVTRANVETVFEDVKIRVEGLWQEIHAKWRADEPDIDEPEVDQTEIDQAAAG
ncbi:MAG: low molecular weight phosphatase family protein [Gulosibacter sp.]|uniref:arsenate-mycothiol transferase ArsC n=1 Tax=Gulosibacter sp. TaxID=2817531 RepID=UPI003F927BDF